MGAWGPAPFSDDTGCHIRDEYRDLVADGLDDAEVTRRALVPFPRAASSSASPVDTSDKPKITSGYA